MLVSPNILSIDHPHDEPRPPGVFLDGAVTAMGTPEESSPGGIATVAETTTLPPDFYARFSPDTRVGRHAVASEIAAGLQHGSSEVKTNFGNGIVDNDVGHLAVEAVKAPSDQGDQLLEWLAGLGLSDVVVPNQLLSCLAEPSIESFLEVLEAYKEAGSIGQIALDSVADLPEAKMRGRLQQVFDAADGAVMRAHSREAVVIDPTYLLDPTYGLLEQVPFTDRPHTQRFVAHTMAGFYWTGSDHTFLYRNRGEVAKAAARGMDDYGVVRPGNYLYHDLVLVENKRGQEEFPVELLLNYAFVHYFHGLDAVAEPGILQPEQHAGTLTYTYDDGERIGVHLRRPEQMVIPFRALRKTEVSDKFYEYGSEAYLAELIDIAGKVDQIDMQQGRNPDFDDELQLGKHLTALPSKVLIHSGNSELAATSWRIIFESRGLSSEDAIEVANHMMKNKDNDANTPANIASLINSRPKVHELWPPLTTSYEWFTRYAREVSEEEMRERGCYNPLLHPLTYK